MAAFPLNYGDSEKHQMRCFVMKRFMSQNGIILLTGVVIGIAALTLTFLGNPANMGFCIACFLRDISGALKLHSTATVQYFRPEIVGIIAGAAVTAFAAKEFKGKGGSSPVIRFILGAFVMIGALMFLGCPLRMVIRIGGGDFNAILGLIGFVAGILAGIIFLKKGFTLNRAYRQSKGEALGLPAVFVILFVFTLVFPAAFQVSAEGPGSMHPLWIVSLVAGLVVGGLCQRSRMCMVGGIRNSVMFKDFSLIMGFAAIIVTVVIGNLILGSFHPGFAGQPVAHSDGLWNFLGMALVGWMSILLGGCPLRQLILAGEGNTDSAVTVIGMIAGAAFCHNFGLASSADGPTFNGKVAVILGFAVAAAVSAAFTWRKEK